MNGLGVAAGEGVSTGAGGVTTGAAFLLALKAAISSGV